MRSLHQQNAYLHESQTMIYLNYTKFLTVCLRVIKQKANTVYKLSQRVIIVYFKRVFSCFDD